MSDQVGPASVQNKNKQQSTGRPDWPCDTNLFASVIPRDITIVSDRHIPDTAICTMSQFHNEKITGIN